MSLTVTGQVHFDSVAILWGLASSLPFFHTHPSNIVCVGAIIVWRTVNLTPAVWNAMRTSLQLLSNSFPFFQPQCKSSAIFTSIPLVNKSPTILQSSSSNAVSDAHCVSGIYSSFLNKRRWSAAIFHWFLAQGYLIVCWLYICLDHKVPMSYGP